MTRKAKSPDSTPAGFTAKADAPSGAGPLPATALTIASRQMSVRDSAHESQTPAAQFSVSKYQLIPSTGYTAAMIAATGRPIWSPRLRASGRE